MQAQYNVNSGEDHRYLEPTIFSRIAFIGNYLPRQCGIATFTTDLCEAFASTYPEVDCFALAMNDVPGGYAYPQRVSYELDQDDLSSYIRAADYLNMSGASLVCLQHEYGIYGGKAGEYILTLLRSLEMPVVTTLHTILSRPNQDQLRVMGDLVRVSDRLVVMSQQGVEDLVRIYHAPAEKIELIPHGIPDVSFVDPNFYKDKFGVEGKMVLLTFGLLSSNKGIENVIKALPAILQEHPEVVYLVVGATHPHVIQNEGEAYRRSLERLAAELGVSSQVRFHNRFVSLDELIEFIGSADIYITPYLNQAQSVSGTLAYTVGAGKAVISTPYLYAEEILGEERGALVPFNDPQAIASQVIELLTDEPLRHAMRKRAYALGREMTWPVVARRYLESFERARLDHQAYPPAYILSHPANGQLDMPINVLPPIKIDHLLRLTGDTGIFQHAIYNIPNFAEGYTTDDNARALMVALQLEEYGGTPQIDIQTLASRYLAFLWYAFVPARGRFRNFLSFGRHWLESEGSGDSQGRAIWSLGAVLGHSNHEGLRRLASRMFPEALLPVVDMNSPRAYAFTLLGLAEYLEGYPGDRRVTAIASVLSRRLVELYHLNSEPGWHWFEDVVTYSNASLPHALLKISPFMPAAEGQKMRGIALEALDWLLEIQTSTEGYFSSVGTAGFYPRGGTKARFDQQPLEAANMVTACLDAHHITADEHWLHAARMVFGWFLGKNDLNLPLIDVESGGCCDGLHPDRVNRNQGAESTLAYLRALLAMHSQETVLQTANRETPEFSFLKLLPKASGGIAHDRRA